MSWIEKIGELIIQAFKSVRPPVTPIPQILLLCEILNRPGISSIALTSSIIVRLENNGIPTGVNPCGMENMNNKAIKIFVEETVKHIKNYDNFF